MRQLSPYEQNHLRRHGIDPETIDQFGDMPVEYITGFATVRGRNFVVDRRVLIPRVEEEALIDLALKEIEKRKAKSLRPELRPRSGKDGIIHFADVGCGSGCIGITLYLELETRGMKPEAYLSDVSEDALAVAQINVDRLVPKPHRIHLLQSDLLSDYELSNHRPHFQFDLIVANLPYIPSERIASLPSSVRDYEPLLALDGGADGLTVINKFLTQAPQYLDKGGFIVIEVDESHRTEQLKQLEKGSDLPERSEPSYSIVVHKDQFGKNRFFVLKRLLGI